MFFEPLSVVFVFRVILSDERSEYVVVMRFTKVESS